MLAETATKDITRTSNCPTFEANKKAAQRGGCVAKVAKNIWIRNRTTCIVSKKAIDLGKLIGYVTKEIENMQEYVKNISLFKDKVKV